MATKTTAEAVSPHLELAENKTDNGGWSLSMLEEEVKEIVKMVDYLRKSSFRDNLIRNEVANGALDMISGRLRMALDDY